MDDLATATDLVRWADLREAQALLPKLVRRLVSATANDLESLSMRSGEGVQLPGWDGFVVAQAADLHVPLGISVWEMGVNKNPASKANEDYGKRRQDPDGVVADEATFIFVTPRRWSNKEEWVSQRKAEDYWKDVVAYDADDLETWLERAPAVHAWLSAQLGKNPYESQSLDNWWNDWLGETMPPLSPTLLLSGRDAKAQDVRQFPRGAETHLTLSGDSQEEVLAFVAAALLTDPDPATPEALDRALIVRTPAAWRRLTVGERPLILLPLYENPDVALALRHEHQVVIPLGREASTDKANELPRLSRFGIEEALREAGLPRDKASRLATLGRRSLLSLRRTLAISKEVQNPVWSHPELAHDVLPALLAGTWQDDIEGDRAAVEKLAGRPYNDVVKALTRWANSSDPPVRRVGNIWTITAKLDAWRLIARSLTSDDLNRFRAVALDVIGSDDPTVGQSPTDRFLASLQGRERPHSGHLIGGLADTLALIAATSEEIPLTDGRRGQDEASGLVRSLLDEANADATGQRWITSSYTLPLMAEAAPDTFLNAVDTDLRGNDPIILKMFQDGEGYTDLFSTSSAHTGLLWALETLAWSIKYLSRTAILLAKLSKLDPGGHLVNRPFNSLTEILILWRSGTGASLQQRLEVVDLLRRCEPNVAWALMLNLIPSMNNHASFPHSPIWRDWKPDGDEVPGAEFYAAVEGIVARSLEDAGTNGNRWIQLLNKITGFPAPKRAEFIEKMSVLKREDFDENERAALSEVLRGVVSDHREFHYATWAMSKLEVDQLAEIMLQLTPDSPEAKHAWMFKMGAARSFDAQDEAGRFAGLAVAQTEAVREVLAVNGLSNVLTWSEQFEAHAILEVGKALARIGLDKDDENAVFSVLTSEVAAHLGVAHGYITQVASFQGEAWLSWLRTTLGEHANVWSPTHLAQVLTLFTPLPEVWGLAEELGQETDHEYWSRVQPYGVADEGESLTRFVYKLLEHGRPYNAVKFLSLYAESFPIDLLNELSAEALELAAQTHPSDLHDNNLSYKIGRHLDRLDETGFDERRLAELEWAYLPLFRHDQRRSRVLHQALATEPTFFIEVLSLTYSAEDAEPQELSDQELSKAETARILLDNWRLVPGIKDDGTIDGEVLSSWVDEARRLLAECKRSTYGEQQIGRVLRYGPAPQDDVWPTEAIQDVFERVASNVLEEGFQVEVYNSRGVTSRGQTDGGEQERSLAAQYRRYADSAGLGRPRTAALLTRIADRYEVDARHLDTSAELTEDFWR